MSVVRLLGGVRDEIFEGVELGKEEGEEGRKGRFVRTGEGREVSLPVDFCCSGVEVVVERVIFISLFFIFYLFFYFFYFLLLFIYFIYFLLLFFIFIFVIFVLFFLFLLLFVSIYIRIFVYYPIFDFFS